VKGGLLMERVLTVNDVKKHFKIGNDKAYEKFNSNDFPSFKLGNSYRVLEKDLCEWIEQKKALEHRRMQNIKKYS
jgi:predicted DNA-binding transcriptional regulator AlpA